MKDCVKRHWPFQAGDCEKVCISNCPDYEAPEREFHKGQVCPYQSLTLCQEGFCDQCDIKKRCATCVPAHTEECRVCEQPQVKADNVLEADALDWGMLPEQPTLPESLPQIKLTESMELSGAKTHSKRCYQQGYNKGLQHQLIHNQLDLIPIYAEYNYLYQQAIQQRDEALGELDREQRWSLFFETERDELQSELAESERKGSYWEEEHQKLYFLDIRRYIFEGKFCKHSLDEKCRFLDMPNDKCLVTGETIRWRMGEPTYKGELCPKPYVAPVPENNQEETDEI